MYKVMIVDDEPAAIKGIRNSLHLDHYQCTIVNESCDGIDALDYLKANAVDIVITDIKMPGMNGIELSQYIFENYPWTKIIILTGFADFTYAQTAIHYNVVDFILKPFLVENVNDALDKAVKLIKKRKEEEEKINLLETEINDRMDDIRDKLIQDIINKVVVLPENIAGKMKKLKMDIDEFIVVAFEIDRQPDESPGASMDTPQEFVSVIKNLISFVFKDHPHFITSISNRYLCLIVCGTCPRKDDFMQSINSTIARLLDISVCLTRVRISIGVSEYHKNPLDLADAYNEALEAITNSFYNGNKVNYYSIGSANNAMGTILNEHMMKTLKYVEAKSSENAMRSLGDLFDEQTNISISINNIMNICFILCSSCFMLLANRNIDILRIINRNVYIEIMKCKNVKQLFDLMTEIVQIVISQLIHIENQNNNIISKTIDYINTNFAKEISLHAIANSVHVSASYLSHLFKKETGHTIVEHISKVRNERAKSLLVSSDHSIYEIAAMIGICDSAYFSYQFKKYTGYSPKEYKAIRRQAITD